MLIPYRCRLLSPITTVTLLAVVLVLPVVSASEASVEAAAEKATPSPAQVLPDQVVTAQKVEQMLEDIPASVSTVNGDFVEEIGALGFEDVLAYVGNIDFRLNPFGGSIRIRGFGNPATNAGFESAVGLVVDGVPYGRTNFLSAFFHDIDRVEVLRGPQGTLFGKNSTAGLLNIVTRRPETLPGAELTLVHGEFGETSVRPAVNLNLGNNLLVRASGNYARRQGRLFNTTLQRQETDLSQEISRLRVNYAPLGSAWELDLSVFHSRQRMNNGEFQFIHATEAMREFAQGFDPDFSTDPSDFRTALNLPSLGEITFSGASANIETALPALLGLEKVTLVSTSGWAESVLKQRSLDADFTPAPFLARTQPESNPYNQVSQELRISGSAPDFRGRGHGFRLTAGAFYQRSTLLASDLFEIEDLGTAAGFLLAAQGDDGPPGLQGGGAGQLGRGISGVLSALLPLLSPGLDPLLGKDQRIFARLDQDTEALALFGQAEYDFLPRWTMIGGLRVGRETKAGQFLSRAEGEIISLIGEQEDHESFIRRRESELSPKFGLRWMPRPRVSVYSTWSRGFKGGGFNAIPLTPEKLDFEPERATNIELGTSARLLRGRLRFAATAFTTDFRNLQVSTFRDNRFFILNAAEARSRGLEIDLNWLPPINGLSILTSGGFADARFTRYPNAPAPADSGMDSQDLSGRRLPFSPRWNASLVPAYVFPVGFAGLSLSLSGDLQYRSSRFLDVDLDQRTRQSETMELGVRAALSPQHGRWSLTLAGQNLTNEVVLEQVFSQPLAPGNFVGIRRDRGRFGLAILRVVL